MPGAMHSGFAQFAAFDQDVIDNRAFLSGGGRLKMPVLAVGGAKSFGPMMATVMRAAADDVTEAQVPAIYRHRHAALDSGKLAAALGFPIRPAATVLTERP